MITSVSRIVELSRTRETQLDYLLETILYHLNRMESNYTKLEKIGRRNTSYSIRKKAFDFLQKQTKIIEIAVELKIRIENFKNQPIPSNQLKVNAFIDQLNIEFEILAEMHFRLTKSYTTFTSKYFITLKVHQLSVA